MHPPNQAIPSLCQHLNPLSTTTICHTLQARHYLRPRVEAVLEEARRAADMQRAMLRPKWVWAYDTCPFFFQQPFTGTAIWLGMHLPLTD